MKLAVSIVLLLTTAPTTQATDVTVTVENLGSDGALFLTPFWLGIHDGTFDLYNTEESAAGFGGLESIAEDGATADLMSRFDTEQAATGGVNTTLTAETIAPPPFNPGESSSFVFTLDNPSANRYLSYGSMVIPSNDAFIANGDPLAHPVFDSSGNFTGPFTIDIMGAQVLDAGTEVNGEVDVAFLAAPNGQTGPNMGADESGVVRLHGGFNGSVGNVAATPMNILGGTTASGATIDATLGDFTAGGGGVLLARITVVPEPSTMGLASLEACLALQASAEEDAKSLPTIPPSYESTMALSVMVT